MTEIYLIRHGETEWNKERRFQGHTNVQLSELGVEQAVKLADRLVSIEFSTLYSSDLDRAYITAKTLGDRIDKQVNKTRSIREISYGIWEGMNYTEIMEKYPAEGKEWFSDPINNTIPGGDSIIEVKKKIRKELDMLAKNHEGERIALFAHGGIIRTMLISCLDLKDDLFWKMDIGNTSISVLTYKENEYFLERINDCAHLHK